MSASATRPSSELSCTCGVGRSALLDFQASAFARRTSASGWYEWGGLDGSPPRDDREVLLVFPRCSQLGDSETNSSHLTAPQTPEAGMRRPRSERERRSRPPPADTSVRAICRTSLGRRRRHMLPLNATAPGPTAGRLRRREYERPRYRSWGGIRASSRSKIVAKRVSWRRRSLPLLLRSTSGAARGQWDLAHWRRLADALGSAGDIYNGARQPVATAPSSSATTSDSSLAIRPGSSRSNASASWR